MREDIKNRLIGATRQFRHNSDNSPDTHKPREGFVFGYDRGEVDELVGDLLGELEAARAQQGQGRDSDEAPIVWINPENIKRTMIAAPGETVEVSAYREGDFTAPLYTHPTESGAS